MDENQSKEIFLLDLLARKYIDINEVCTDCQCANATEQIFVYTNNQFYIITISELLNFYSNNFAHNTHY